MSSEGPDSVEEVTVLLSGLEITISARRLPVGASASAGTGISAGGTPVPRDTPEDFSDPYNITSEVEDHCIQATTPAQLSQLTLPFLTALVGRFSCRSSCTPSIGRQFPRGGLTVSSLSELLLHLLEGSWTPVWLLDH